MLLALYGLHASEVVALRLDDIDWDHDRLHVARVKGRGPQVYPLLPSVGHAIVRYVQTVRRPSAHREIFLTFTSPVQPLSRSTLCSVVAPRRTPSAPGQPIGVRTRCGTPAPRAWSPAGLSLKEIGDYLRHRSTAATRVYAKIDLPHLREVAAFDLGGLR